MGAQITYRDFAFKEGTSFKIKKGESYSTFGNAAGEVYIQNSRDLGSPSWAPLPTNESIGKREWIATGDMECPIISGVKSSADIEENGVMWHFIRIGTAV